MQKLILKCNNSWLSVVGVLDCVIGYVGKWLQRLVIAVAAKMTHKNWGLTNYLHLFRKTFDPNSGFTCVTSSGEGKRSFSEVYSKSKMGANHHHL